jgi:hypothetical protein
VVTSAYKLYARGDVLLASRMECCDGPKARRQVPGPNLSSLGWLRKLEGEQQVAVKEAGPIHECIIWIHQIEDAGVVLVVPWLRRAS